MFTIAISHLGVVTYVCNISILYNYYDVILVRLEPSKLSTIRSADWHAIFMTYFSSYISAVVSLINVQVVLKIGQP